MLNDFTFPQSVQTIVSILPLTQESCSQSSTKVGLEHPHFLSCTQLFPAQCLSWGSFIHSSLSFDIIPEIFVNQIYEKYLNYPNLSIKNLSKLFVVNL